MARVVQLRALATRQGLGMLGLLGLAVLLLVPQLPVLLQTPLPLAVAAGVAGYLPRRSRADALWLALPLAGAEAVESVLGPQVLACLVLPLYAATRRPRLSALLGAALFALLLAAIHLKERYAGTPLTWHDIRFFFLQFRDNVGVMASQPSLQVTGALALAALGLVAVAGWRWDGQGATRAAGRTAVLVALIAIGTAAWSLGELREAARRTSTRHAWALGQATTSMSAPLWRFIATAGLEPRWTPAPVPTADFRRAVQRWQHGVVAAGRPADIVVFLQESQFNPAAIQGCPPALCRLSAFEPSADTLAQGPLKVHVFGGGTWLSEFAALTGVPHAVFGRAGDFAPFNVAPGVQRSFVRSLRQAGYRTAAVYPVGGGMMNARSAYRGYGFDAFHDAADLGLSGRFDTSDEAMHGAALRILEQERRHGQPVFLFVVSIFNHGEHGIELKRVPPELRQQARALFPHGREGDNVADYLWRSREFERAMAHTARSVLGAGRPAVLAWFGDHQPPFGNAVSLRARIGATPGGADGIEPKFRTWYAVRSNLPAPPALEAPGPLDVAFLPGLLAQAAGVELDDWLAANVAARVECGGLLLACRQPATRDAYLGYLGRDLGAFRLD